MRKLIVFGTILAVLGMVAAWYWVRPAYQRHQERQWLRLAQTSMERGDYSAASRSLQEVLQRDPDNLTAWEISVRLAEISRSPDLLARRARLAQLAPTTENRLALASTALRMESPPFPFATSTLDQLREAGVDDAGFHVVSAERALRLRAFADAERHLAEAIRLEPTNGTHAMNLAVLRLQSADAKVAESAREQLLALTRDPAVALPALRSLATLDIRHKDAAGALQHSQRILADTNSVFSDRVQHLNILHAIRSPERDSYHQSLEQAAGTNLPDVAELAMWRNRHGFESDTIRTLNALPQDLRKELPIPVLLAEAHMLQKEWKTLQKTLRAEQWGSQDFMRLAMLARAAQEQGDEVLAKTDWERAVHAALDRPDAISALLAAGQTWGWSTAVERLLWLTSRKYPNDPWPMKALERLYLVTGNSQALLDLYSARLEREPTNALAKNDVAAVSLLLKANLKRAHTLAKEAFEVNQTNPATASTYAFSLHLQGKTAEGLEVMNQMPEEQRRNPSIAAYYALLLTAAGDAEKASTYRQLAQRAPLLPEERQLLK